jgi:hypothetical protein
MWVLSASCQERAAEGSARSQKVCSLYLGVIQVCSISIYHNFMGHTLPFIYFYGCNLFGCSKMTKKN